MSVTRKYTGSEPQRVNKFMGQSGLCSRREAEALIEKGLVSINGTKISSPGHKILPGQTLELTAKTAAKLETKFTAVIHKPEGIVSAQPDPGQTPAVRLLTKANLIGKGIPPKKTASLPALGRLDMDSRGLLLLSEDGVLAKALIGPSSALEKEYIVKVTGQITPAKIDKLCHGLELDGRKLKRAKVTRLGQRGLRFILTEGRNRQIRRMCDLVDLRVYDLYRTRIGPLELGSLREGKWRVLSAKERAALIRSSSGGDAPKAKSPAAR
ncbi:MAG: pseudouridine synthase [Pseudomonadota bacterium]